MKDKEQFKNELEELLEAHAAKTSAYYRKENFGGSEDEDQEWDACYEEGYQDRKCEFIDKWAPIR